MRADQLSHDDREFLRQKWNIEHMYAEPYLTPGQRSLPRAERRRIIKNTVRNLPKNEWVAMQSMIEDAWVETHGTKDSFDLDG